MKSIKLLPLLLVFMFLLSACSGGKTPKVENVYTRADLTHDGTKERITTCLTDIEDGEGYVSINATDSNNNNVVLLKEKLGTSKKDHKGIYLCNRNGKIHLMVFKPTYDGDTTTLEYSVSYLDFDEEYSKTEKVTEIKESITYTKEQVKEDGDKYDEASAFVKTLNKYISKSMALVDTVDGEIVYSPNAKEKKFKQYYPEWYNKDYEPTTSIVHSSKNANTKENKTETTESKTDTESSQYQTNSQPLINH